MSLRPLAAAAACLILAACAAPPGGERLQSASVQAEGQAQARSYVDVMRRMEPVAEAECRRRSPDLNCDFRIVVDESRGLPSNAYYTVGEDGRPIIALTLALVATAGPDELAFDMAHEASHHILGHRGRMDRNAEAGARIFQRIAEQNPGATPRAIRDAAVLGAQFGALSYSQEFELEADRLAVPIMLAAGFDPVRGTEFFLAIEDPPPGTISTHPAGVARRQAILAQLGLI